MSLDVYLIWKEIEEECTCDCWHTHMKTRRQYLYDSNITHNLGKMAEAVGIYKALWRPEEIGCIYAKDIIPLLEGWLKNLKRAPVKYSKYNSENGWWTYVNFVPFVEKYLEACKEYPEAKIEVSR